LKPFSEKLFKFSRTTQPGVFEKHHISAFAQFESERWKKDAKMIFEN